MWKLVLAAAVIGTGVTGWCAGEAGTAAAQGVKVNLSVTDLRKDLVMPHWENWRVADGRVATQEIGNLKVTLAARGDGKLHAVVYKALLESGVHMGLTGVTAPEGMTLTIHGLTPGKHSVVTYHNEVQQGAPGKYDVTVDGGGGIKGLTPTRRATSDYDAAASYLQMVAEAGKDVVVTIAPEDTGGGCILNGFEIDTSDPHKKAIKPLPANDDEHVAADAALQWTAPAGVKLHDVYLGTDPEAVARATKGSPEFRGALAEAKFPLPKLDLMGTYYWRVDEEVDGEGPVKGEVWMFRPRMLAFPTAEGYGRFARGGRGGRVIEVTNLEDYDAGEPAIPGSYRAAIEAEGPRTVVFRVSGLIRLKRSCPITNPYITIAGQTAPGEGICLANYSASVQTHDAIVRFMHVRIGDISHRAMDGMSLSGCDACIIDHCSLSWAMDEANSSRGAKNITFQWNIISEMLNHAYHYKAGSRDQFERHAFAASISGNIGSYHHNLLADCTDRNWSLAGGYDQANRYAGHLDIRNNVVYNWTRRTTDGGVMQLDYVNNYYKPYPKQDYVKWLLKLDPVDTSHGTPQYYMVGNVMEGEDYDADNWKAFQNGPRVEKIVRVDKPLYESYVKTETAREAYPLVLAGAGAIYPQRDVVDKRIVEEVRTGTVHYTGTKGPTSNPPGTDDPGIIDTQDDVKDAVDSPNAPWPAYRSAPAPADSDHDGMPDAWEQAHGLNPHDAADGNADPGTIGYTNLERYLGSLVGEFAADGSVKK
jgi:hypothetical protein